MNKTKVVTLVGVRWFKGQQLDCEEVCSVGENNEIRYIQLTGICDNQGSLVTLLENIASNLRDSGFIVRQYGDKGNFLSKHEMNKTFVINMSNIDESKYNWRA